MEKIISTTEEVTDASAHTHVKCYKCGFVNPADPNKSDLENYKDYALGEGPFLLQVEISMYVIYSYKLFYNYVAKLLDALSLKLFGAQYYHNEELCLHGFAFYSTSDGYTSIKILLKYNVWYDKFSFNSFTEIFEKVVRPFPNCIGVNVQHHQHCNLQRQLLPET